MNLENGVLQVHIEDIIPNRFQPRLNFDEEGLKELSDSIKEHGIIQPLVLRKLGNKYEIIAGERRYKAAQQAGLQTVPAVIANVDDNTSAEVALVENVQRRDLTAIEEARSYKSLLDKGYLTQEQLAKRMGLSQPAIANKLRLLNLDDEVQQALLDEKISERHARTLLSIEDKALQRQWLHRIINERLTVRQLDQELKKTKEVDEVPLIEQNKTVEEIKATAQDVNPKREKSATERPIIETYNEPATKPEINIATPNSTIDLASSEPQSNNMFFNLPEEPIESSTSQEQLSNKKIEIYIDPSEAQTNFVEPITTIEKPVVKKKPEPEIKNPVKYSTDNIFFQPPVEEHNYDLDINDDTAVDPMDVIDTVVEEELSPKVGSYELPEALNDIRKLAEELESKGFKIELEEAALTDEYEIKINIKKATN